MTKKISPVPPGFESAIPYLCIKGADKAIDFYKQVFDAVEEKRFIGPHGKIMHAAISIGKAHIFLTEEVLEWNSKSPTTIGDSATTTLLYFEDVDAIAAKATAAGATFMMPVADMFWGDRSGCFIDPFGHKWMISSRIEELSDEDLQKRAAGAFAQGGCEPTP